MVLKTDWTNFSIGFWEFLEQSCFIVQLSGNPIFLNNLSYERTEVGLHTLALGHAFPINFYMLLLIFIFLTVAPVLCISFRPYCHPVFWQGKPLAPDSGGSGPSSLAPCRPALSGTASKEPQTPQLASQWILFCLGINFPLCWSSTKGGEATSPPGAQDPTDLKTARWPQGDRLPLHCWIDKMEGQEICNHRVSQWRPTCRALSILGHNKCIQRNALIHFIKEEIF